MVIAEVSTVTHSTVTSTKQRIIGSISEAMYYYSRAVQELSTL